MALTHEDLEHIKTITVASNVPLVEMVGKLHGKFEGVSKSLADHHKTLYGNGVPGISQTTARLANRAKIADRLLWSAIGAFFLVAVPAVIGAIVWAIRSAH